MKHTPGPWKLRVNPDENDRLRHLYFIDGPENGQPICEVRNYQKIGENNGSLIAAAPEMYEALRELTRIIVTTGDINALNDAVKNALDAINKAEGK